MNGSNAIYALTPQGADLARRIAGLIGGRIFLPAGLPASASTCGDIPEIFFFDRLATQLSKNFQYFQCHIMICASGIAIRSLAPLLQGKDKDPAVLLLDQAGRFVISLLSGHLGGANRLCRDLAEKLGAVPVVTTGTDTENLPAIDEMAKDKKLRIVNLEAVRQVSAALLRGERPWVVDVQDRLELNKAGLERFFTIVSSVDEIASAFGQSLNSPEPRRVAILVDQPESFALPGCQTLFLKSNSLWLGIGCRRGTGIEKLETFVRNILETAGYRLWELSGIASIDLKADEPGLLELSARLNLPLRFFPAAELCAIPCPNPSKKVKEITGSPSVCEAAAILAAGGAEMRGELLLHKTGGNGITLALARDAHGNGKNKPEG